MPASGTPPTSGRCAAVWGATTLGVGSVQAWLLPATASALRGPRPTRFEEVLVAGCELAAVASTAWLWALVSLVVLDLVRGRDAARRRAVPRALCRAVLAACGLSLASGLAVPAHAGTDDAPDPEAVAQLLVGLPLPDRTTPTTAWVRRVSDRAAAPGLGTDPPDPAGDARPSVRVRPGDTLWNLAATTLPVDADDTEIDRRWREIYQLNRSAIGADPDLIRPGQRLLLPQDPPREEP